MAVEANDINFILISSEVAYDFRSLYLYVWPSRTKLNKPHGRVTFSETSFSIKRLGKLLPGLDAVFKIAHSISLVFGLPKNALKSTKFKSRLLRI